MKNGKQEEKRGSEDKIVQRIKEIDESWDVMGCVKYREQAEKLMMTAKEDRQR